jgi:hypothetical protein
MAEDRPQPPERHGQHAADRLRQFEQERYGEDQAALPGQDTGAAEDSEHEEGPEAADGEPNSADGHEGNDQSSS